MCAVTTLNCRPNSHDDSYHLCDAYEMTHTKSHIFNMLGTRRLQTIGCRIDKLKINIQGHRVKVCNCRFLTEKTPLVYSPFSI